MQKVFRSFLFLFTLGLLLLHGERAVKAAPITGMVGVGTWNTQAEFADIKVTQGTQTLYQSNFNAGISEWQVQSGTWQTTADGTLRQTGGDTPATALVGNPNWSNYTLTLKARKLSGAEGFLITFGSPGDNTKTWWNIGGWGNTLSVLEVPGVSVPAVGGSLETGRWYDIKVELNEGFVRCYLDGVLIHDTNPKPIMGMIGVGTWATQADFADVKVTQGTQTLYQSNFAAGFSEWKQLGGTWQTTSDGLLRQTSNNTPATLLVGDPTWGNYTLTLKARKNSGAEGFLISFGSPGDSTVTWWNIGGWGNTRTTLQAPGFWVNDVVNDAGKGIQNGQWYDIKIEVRDSDLRCYLNGVLIHDTTRILNTTERNLRFQDLLDSTGFNLLNSAEQQWLRDLAGRNVYVGAAARATFAAMPGKVTFATLTPSQQAAIIRKVNRNRLTWNTGWGFGGEAWRDNDIINSMDGAVIFYNQNGLFDKHLTANNSPGTPTADAGYDGQMRFGGQRGYRTALHEISHTLGTGTYWRWGQMMVNNRWTGFYANDQLSKFEGAGSVMNGDGQHYWPYGMNQDWEYSDENAYRMMRIIQGFRRDMGIATVDVTGTTEVANGAYILSPRHAPNSALNASSGANGTLLDIRANQGTTNQKFIFELQGDGTYSVRTALTGGRSVELPGGGSSNGVKLTLQSTSAISDQRFYLVPTPDGWYRLSPKNNLYRAWDIDGVSTADGALAQSWDYLDGFNQQWLLTSASNPAPVVTALAPAKAIVGSDATTMTVTGSGFISDSVIRWNDTVLPTKFVSPTQLTATIPADALAVPGSNKVMVSSPTPGGGLSAQSAFLVGVPSLKSAQATATRSGNTITVTVTLTNTGTVDAPGLSLTNASLVVSGKTVSAASLPVSAGSIASGASATVTLSFPAAGVAGGAGALRLSGAYNNSGTFSTSSAVSVPR